MGHRSCRMRRGTVDYGNRWHNWKTSIVYGQSSFIITTPQSSGASQDSTMRQVNAFHCRQLPKHQRKQQKHTNVASATGPQGHVQEGHVVMDEAQLDIPGEAPFASLATLGGHDGGELLRGYAIRRLCGRPTPDPQSLRPDSQRVKVSLASMFRRLRRIGFAINDGLALVHGIRFADWN